jgi:hypothetical protein
MARFVEDIVEERMKELELLIENGGTRMIRLEQNILAEKEQYKNLQRELACLKEFLGDDCHA